MGLYYPVPAFYGLVGRCRGNIQEGEKKNKRGKIIIYSHALAHGSVGLVLSTHRTGQRAS